MRLKLLEADAALAEYADLIAADIESPGYLSEEARVVVLRKMEDAKQLQALMAKEAKAAATGEGGNAESGLLKLLGGGDIIGCCTARRNPRKGEGPPTSFSSEREEAEAAERS